MFNKFVVSSIALNAALLSGGVFGSRPVMFVVYLATVGAFALGQRILDQRKAAHAY